MDGRADVRATGAQQPAFSFSSSFSTSLSSSSSAALLRSSTFLSCCASRFLPGSRQLRAAAVASSRDPKPVASRATAINWRARAAFKVARRRSDCRDPKPLRRRRQSSRTRATVGSARPRERRKRAARATVLRHERAETNKRTRASGGSARRAVAWKFVIEGLNRRRRRPKLVRSRRPFSLPATAAASRGGQSGGSAQYNRRAEIGSRAALFCIIVGAAREQRSSLVPDAAAAADGER